MTHNKDLNPTTRPTDSDPSYAERHGLDLGVEHRVNHRGYRKLVGYIPFSQMSVMPGWNDPGAKTVRWQKWENS